MEKEKIIKKIEYLEHLEKVYIAYSSTYNEEDTHKIRLTLLNEASKIREEIEKLRTTLNSKND
jgi:CDP-glycerol glycerophosphotransferase (TagB/SpsB family)